MQIKHTFTSQVTDNAVPAGRVQPSNWNDQHEVVITGALKAIDALLASADKLAVFTGPETAELVTITAYTKALLAAVNAAAAREALDAQAAHPRLEALSALAGGADQLPFSDSATGMAQTPFTALARSLLAAGDASAMRALVGAVNIAGDIMTGALTLSGDPVSALHAASKQYVDNVAAGLDVKPSVRAASVGDVDIASAPAALDGVTGVAGDRWLLKDQAVAAQNGIYVFAAAGSALIRAADMDAWAEVPGALVLVEDGATHADSGWVCSADAGGALGTTAITWSQFFGAGLFQPASASLSTIAALASIANLVALAGLTGAADKVPVFTGPGAMATRSIGVAANNLIALDGSGKLPAIDVSQATNWPGAAAATQAEQEVASSTAAYVSPARQHFHLSACKGWVQADFTAGAPASYNVSSVTDVGVGNVQVNWATVFSSANYGVLCTVVGTPVGSSASTLVGQISNSLAAGSVGLNSIRMSDFLGADGSFIMCAAFGDL